MKKFFRTVLAIAAMLVALPASAIGPGIFNHLSLGLSAGTNGIGIEAATPVTRFLNLRAGVSFVPGITFGTDVDGTYNHPEYGQYGFTMDVDGNLKRTQGHVILNFYPIPVCGLFVAAGGYFGGSTLLGISGHSDELANLSSANASIEIGDYHIPVDKNGNVSGELRTKSFRPYLGLGWGRAVPGRRVNFNVELGVQFMGKSKVYAGGEELTKVITDSDDDWQKVMDKLTVYPVLKFTLNGRIF